MTKYGFYVTKNQRMISPADCPIFHNKFRFPYIYEKYSFNEAFFFINFMFLHVI